MDTCSQFIDKRITLMGLGVLGRGVGDAVFIAECGAELTITDLKTEEQLQDSVEQLRRFKNVRFVLGEHREEDFTNADLVIKGNGVPLGNKYIQAAEEAGVRVAMSTALFATQAVLRGALLVGITGTRGKSTVTHMVYEAVKRSGARVHLGGNVRGISTLALLPEIQEGDIVILELDSWQLQGFGYEELSPQIAVFTNFYPDHLNYYPDMETYFSDKAHIYTHQDKSQGDVLIAGDQVADKIDDEDIVAVPLPSDWTLQVPGEHNRYNAGIAREVLVQIGMSDEEIREALAEFRGIEGRLEYMGEFGDGVRVYNDNNATTPEATLAAFDALDGDIILIAGGTDKQTELSKVAEKINERCKAVHLLEGTGTEKIVPLLKGAVVHKTFKQTIDAALGATSNGDTVLFSPLFSSFGKDFANEYDRNDKFKKLIHDYYDN